MNPIKSDSRYTINPEYTGHASGKPVHVLRFAGEFIASWKSDDKPTDTGSPQTGYFQGGRRPPKNRKTPMPYHIQQHYRHAARRRQEQADCRHLIRWLIIYALAFATIAALALS